MRLACYYQRFIRSYGVTSKPPANLLKEDGFIPAAQQAFEILKVAFTSALVLALPSPDKEFVIETDACDVDIRAMLIQDDHSITYISKVLALKH